ncbi:MAG: hypothetical protein JWQ74_2950 [Marmoricola sp.]|nr:hypothetical protein [Marmoricola sp.]
MTTTLDRTLTAPSVSDLRTVLAWPVLAGLALGVGDLLVMTNIAYPWANLANSSAIWALGAFVLGAVMRTDPVRAAAAGVVMLLVAVESYYLYAALTDLGGVHTAFSTTAQMWMVFGVVAGVVFGIAGSWTSGSVWWQRVVGAAAGASVLLGESVHTFANLGRERSVFASDLAEIAVVMVVLGVVVLVASSRRTSVLAAATVLAVPGTLFCAAAFSAVGIAY